MTHVFRGAPQKGAHIWEWRGSPFTLFPPHHLARQRTRLRKEKQAAGGADKGLEGEWQGGRLRRRDPPAPDPAEQLPICVLARQPVGAPHHTSNPRRAMQGSAAGRQEQEPAAAVQPPPHSHSPGPQ